MRGLVTGWKAAALAIFAACGGVSEAANPDAGDAEPTEDASAPDAVAPPDGAEELGPWGDPVVLAFEDPDLTYQNPSLTADLLELYVNLRLGPGSSDLYVAKRNSVGEPFTDIEEITELNTAGNDKDPGVSADGRTLWFASNRGESQGLDIWVSTRASRSDPWSTPVAVGELNSPADDREPQVTDDALTMIFHSERVGSEGGSPDLYLATRSAIDSTWSTISALEGINSTSLETGGQLVAEGRHLRFCSDQGGASLLDVFIATRDSTDDPFSVSPIAELNTEENDCAPWVSANERTIVYARAGELVMSTR